jgi:hypothetical protein
MFLDDGIEAHVFSASLLVMRQLNARGVEGYRTLRRSHFFDFVRLDEDELSRRVYKPLDQPGAGYPVHLGSLAGHPLHWSLAPPPSLNYLS